MIFDSALLLLALGCRPPHKGCCARCAAGRPLTGAHLQPDDAHDHAAGACSPGAIPLYVLQDTMSQSIKPELRML